MAHGSGDLDYLVQDESGKIITVMHHKDIKKEPSTLSPVYAQQTDTISGPQYVRLQNSFNVQQAGNSSYYKSTQSGNTRQQHTTIKYESPHLTNIKSEDGPKFTIRSSQSQSNSSSIKSKPHSSTHTVQTSISRRRKSDKAGKGLRHFSMKVCEKVKEKGTTTYNEVADELVAEEVESCQTYDSANCDQKNIRRRVYDALNVLMAMNIISKDKKEIRWIGLPTNSVQQCNTIEKENQKRRERIALKQKELKELLLQQVSVRNLVERNKESERKGFVPAANSTVQLPFIIINTHKTTKVNCSVSADKSEYFFKFNDKFEIHDDIEVLNRMGLLLGLDKGECTYEEIEKAKSVVPSAYHKYIENYGRGQDDVLSDDWEISYVDTVDSGNFSRTDHTSEHGDMEEDLLLSDSSEVD